METFHTNNHGFTLTFTLQKGEMASDWSFYKYRCYSVWKRKQFKFLYPILSYCWNSMSFKENWTELSCYNGNDFLRKIGYNTNLYLKNKSTFA